MTLLRRRSTALAVDFREVALAQKAVRFLLLISPSAAPAAIAPARSQTVARFALAPAANRPGSSRYLTPSAPASPGSGVADPSARPPAACQRSGSPGRCTGRKIAPCARSLLQRRHQRAGRFLLHPRRVVGLARRVVQHLNQVVPTIILEPAMLTHRRPGAATSRATAGAVAASAPSSQPRPLQG